MRRVFSLVSLCIATATVVFASQTAATKMTLDTTWKCGAPESVSALPVPGSAADHAYTIYSVKCTAAKGSINGVKEKSGVATEFAEAKGSSSNGHGVFEETLENGDKITYNYTFSATVNNKVVAAGGNTWTIGTATGKMKGIAGNGTCKAKGNADGSADFACTGTYTMGK